MKSLVIILLINLCLLQPTISQDNDCSTEMKHAYNYILKTYIQYEYKELLNDSTKLFFIINVVKFDSINCVMTLLLSSRYEFEILKELIGDYYYEFDGQLVIIREKASYLKTIIPMNLQILDSNTVTNFKDQFIQIGNRLLSDHDYGLQVTFESNYHRIISFNVGQTTPIFIFNDYK
jgi:hypothetical protein